MNLDTQDQIVSDEDKGVDRKELLNQQFDEVETAEPQGKPRAENGKYVAAKPAPQAEPDAEEPVWKRPPSSWKRDFHEVWQTADPRLQEYAYKREEEMRAGTETAQQRAVAYDHIQQVMEPYMPTINGLGLDAPRAIKGLMESL